MYRVFVKKMYIYVYVYLTKNSSCNKFLAVKIEEKYSRHSLLVTKIIARDLLLKKKIKY